MFKLGGENEIIHLNVQGQELEVEEIHRDSSFSGVYILLNSKNDKLYVGSSINVRRRTKEHIRELKSSSHSNVHLQRVFNNDPSAICVFLLERSQKDDLLNREQYWMDFFESYQKEKGYNMLPIAGSTQGYKVSEEVRQKIRLASLNQSDETRIKRASSNSIPIVQLDLNGNLIKIYKSSKEAKECLGTNYSSITSCCKGNVMTVQGYIWEYLDTYLNEDYDSTWRICKKVVQINKKGEVIKLWNSISEITGTLPSYHNASNSMIIKCCEGELNHYKDYMWMYLDDFFYSKKQINKYIPNKRAVIQYDLDMNVVNEWESALQASKNLGIDSSAIYKCIKGKVKTYKSFIWRNAIEAQ